MISDTHLSKSVMIVAGEASGDVHGSGLVRAMLEKDSSIHFFGVGGKELEKSGVDLVCDIDRLAVMGVSEIFSTLKDILQTYTRLKKALRTQRPDLVILIDFAEFNLRIAKMARQEGIPVFYYITPKVWVWRKRRVTKLAARIDRAGVILPFEEEYLQKRGVEAHYVGNPVLDSVSVKLSRSAFCQKHSICADKVIIGILPGSRRKEVAFLLPIFLEAARRMQKKYSRELAFVLPLASTLTVDDLNDSGLQEYEKDLDVHVLQEDRYDLMAACDAVAAASGTVTLELAVLGTPMIVAYKFSPISYYIGKLLIDIPYFSLANIIAEKHIVPELLQHQVNPATVELELARILFDEKVRNEMKEGLAGVRDKIGGPGASKKAARLAFHTMGRS